MNEEKKSKVISAENENSAPKNAIRIIAGLAAAVLCVMLIINLIRAFANFDIYYISKYSLRSILIPLIKGVGLFLVAWELLLSGRSKRLRLGFILVAVGAFAGVFFGGNFLTNLWGLLMPLAYLLPVLAESEGDSRKTVHCMAICSAAACFIIYFFVVTVHKVGYSGLPNMLLSCAVPILFVLPQLGQPLFSKT